MKFWKCMLTVLIALVLVIGLVSYLGPPPPVEAVPEAQAIGPRPLVPYLAHLYREVSADTWSILVDLSDNTDYPHANTRWIVLKSLDLAGGMEAAKEWHPHVGVVVSVTTASMGVEWIQGSILTGTTSPNYVWPLPEHGLNLQVASGSLAFVATNAVTTTTAITSSTMISTAVWYTGTVGVGDLILWLDEMQDGTTLRFSVGAAYDTE